MTTATNMPPVVKIPRARGIYEIPLSDFLPDQIRQAANPKDPNVIEISRYAHPEDPADLKLCIYDRSKTMWPSAIAGIFKSLGEAEFEDLKELVTENNRIYQPVFFCSGESLSDTTYDYFAEVASLSVGRGITRSFYDNFRDIIRQCGYTFLGSNCLGTETVSFFIRSGARFLEEFADPTVLAPHGESFTPKERAKFVTISHVLNHKHEKRFIREELRDSSIRERLALLARVQQVKQLIGLIKSVPPTNEAISTICEIMEDIKERGVPFPINFLHLDSDAALTGRIIERQSDELWQHAYELTVLYTKDEIEEFIEWLEQA